MRVIETLTVIGTAWIALAVYQKKEELVYYLVGAVVLLFLLKYYTNSVCEKDSSSLISLNSGRWNCVSSGMRCKRSRRNYPVPFCLADVRRVGS